MEELTNVVDFSTLKNETEEVQTPKVDALQFDGDAYDAYCDKKFEELCSRDEFTLKDIFIMFVEAFANSSVFKEAEKIVFDNANMPTTKDIVEDATYCFIKEHCLEGICNDFFNEPRE